MYELEGIPLFRTAQQPAMRMAGGSVTQTEAAAVTMPDLGDLTGYVGQTVDGATWAALQQRLQQRKYEGWTLQARPASNGWHIYRLHMAALADEGEQAKRVTSDDLVTVR